MLDVHIAMVQSTPPEWLQQCVGSVLEAARRSPFRVNVHLVQGVPGRIGDARAVGYAQGSEPYVTYVDDDDYILPEAFEKMDSAIRRYPEALFMAESQLQNGRLSNGPQRHHLCVYRRNLIIDHTRWIVCGDLAQMTAVADKFSIDVPDRVYVHRLYQSGGRRLRREHHDELRTARG
jgi:glycosyltransferase involved in cell wall biosynthesis